MQCGRQRLNANGRSRENSKVNEIITIPCLVSLYKHQFVLQNADAFFGVSPWTQM
jgi:hypothetical protein